MHNTVHTFFFFFLEKQYTTPTLIKIYSKTKLISRIDSKDKYKSPTRYEFLLAKNIKKLIKHICKKNYSTIR